MLRLFLLVISLLTAAPSLAQDRLPAYVLQLPESVSDVFIADASTATFYRFEKTADGLRVAHEGYMSIGQSGAGKERAWDGGTPLGVYFVVDELDTSRLHEKYGVTAFPLDYPNTWDRKLERGGDGIWVHGVLPGGGQRPERDTEGCIALPNADLAALRTNFLPTLTPVIVTRSIRWQDAASMDATRLELVAAVDAWAQSSSDTDVHAYLSLYADDFVYRGMSLGEWASFRLQTMAQRSGIRITIDDLLLLADPEDDGLVLSRFTETSSGPGNASRTIKRLYWRRDSAGQWRIVAEDNG